MEPSVPQNNTTNTPQISGGDSKRSHKIIIGVLVVLVVLLLLTSLWLVRQNRKNETADNAATINNVASTMNSVNAVANTSSANSESNSTTPSSTGAQNNTATQNSGNTEVSGAPHVVSSSPTNGASVAESSLSSVSVVFDRALDTSSLLSVTKESLPYRVGTGVTTFSSDKKTMTLSINSSSNSVYTIHYTACTGENTNCSTGNISFTVGAAGKVDASNLVR